MFHFSFQREAAAARCNSNEEAMYAECSHLVTVRWVKACRVLSLSQCVKVILKKSAEFPRGCWRCYSVCDSLLNKFQRAYFCEGIYGVAVFALCLLGKPQQAHCYEGTLFATPFRKSLNKHFTVRALAAWQCLHSACSFIYELLFCAAVFRRTIPAAPFLEEQLLRCIVGDLLSANARLGKH